MSGNSIKSIRDQVIAAGIIAVISAAIGAVASYFLGWWGAIWQWVGLAFTVIWSFLLSTVDVPMWALALIAALVIFSGLVIAAAVIAQKSDKAAPPFLQYVEDTLRDVIWRWDWVMRDGKYEINDLEAYCPTCDGLLVFKNISRYGVHSCLLICEHCQHTVKATFDGGYHYQLKDLISREVTRRIRTGEFTA